MQFQVIISTADGNQSKDFSNREDAHLYANEWMDGFTHWNHRHFNSVETTEYVNLWKTRNGETVRIIDTRLKISDKVKYCFSGYGQYILFNTIKQAKSYVKHNSTIYRIKDLLTITPTLREKINATASKDVFECIDDVAVPIKIEYETMEDVVREEIEEEGIEETVSDDDGKQWYREHASEFEFHPFVPTCSMCFEREAFYIGVTTHGTPFEFCRVCRDDLVRRAAAAKQSPERFGV